MDEKVGRNDPCPCGSGKKYKNCCIGKPVSKPLPFKAKLLSQPQPVDLMTRTFGEKIAHAEKFVEKLQPNKEESAPLDTPPEQ
jgi:uncharacterized protein